MLEKKEVQSTIVGAENPELSREELLMGVLKIVAPGTNLRAGIDGALKAGKGALIVIENEIVPSLIDGGFRINARFTPQRLIELSKMDGAIILSKDVKRINYANVLLTPDSRIKSLETGTRHKAAERTARQTGTLVIAISERRNEITLYCGKIRYPVLDTDELLRKTNESVQMLEKQRSAFDYNVKKLTAMELRNQSSLDQALITIQKGMLIHKISDDLKKNIIELGREGVLLKTRVREILIGVEKETDFIIKDYTRVDVRKTRAILDELGYEDLLDKKELLRALAYENEQLTEQIKGWRILSKTSLPEQDVALLVRQTGSLGAAIHSGSVFHQEILGKDKAELFREDINKIKIGY